MQVYNSPHPPPIRFWKSLPPFRNVNYLPFPSPRPVSHYSPVLWVHSFERTPCKIRRRWRQSCTPERGHHTPRNTCPPCSCETWRTRTRPSESVPSDGSGATPWSWNLRSCNTETRRSCLTKRRQTGCSFNPRRCWSFWTRSLFRKSVREGTQDSCVLSSMCKSTWV